MNRAELTQCDGVGRISLEARVARLALALESVERRLEGRVDSASRTAAFHADPAVRQSALVRELAYRTALADLRALLADA